MGRGTLCCTVGASLVHFLSALTCTWATRVVVPLSFSFPPSPLLTCTRTSSDGTYRVIVRIMKAGCHPVAIAQVVEH